MRAVRAWICRRHRKRSRRRLQPRLTTRQRQLCWSHLISELADIAERQQGASAEVGEALLNLEGELLDHWHCSKDRTIDWSTLRRCCQPIRVAFAPSLQGLVELGLRKGRVNTMGEAMIWEGESP